MDDDLGSGGVVVGDKAISVVLLGDAQGQREAKPDTLLLVNITVDLGEALPDKVLFLRGNAGALIADVDMDAVVGLFEVDVNDAFVGGVLKGIADYFAQHQVEIVMYTSDHQGAFGWGDI